MTSHVITCADHSDSAVLNCDACKASLHTLRRRADAAGLSLSEQAITEGLRLLRLGDARTAVHRLRLAHRGQIEAVSL